MSRVTNISANTGMGMNAEPQQTALRWLFWIQLAAMAAMEMSAPFWPLHLRTLGQLSAAGLAWASAIAYAGPMLTAMCFTPLWGRIGDRYGHKLMLIRALFALALTQCWIACSDEVYSILLARLLQGALAGFIATAQAYGSMLTGKAQRGALIARLQMATAIGSVIGPMFGGYIYGYLDFHSVNLFASMICILCMVAGFIFLPFAEGCKKLPTTMPQQNHWQTLPPLFAILLAIALVQSAKMMPQVFFVVFAEQVLHAPGWLTGACYGATALGLCAAAPYWARRFANRSEPQILRELESICWACVMLLALQAFSRNPYVFVALRILWGVFLAALLPVLTSLLSDRSTDQQQGWVLGIGNSAAKAGALLGILAGSIALAYLPAIYLFAPVALLYLLCAMAFRIIRQRRNSDSNFSPSLV